MGTGTLQPIATIPGEGYAYATQFTPDGHFLAVGGESKTVLVYDISVPEHPALVATLSGAGSAIYGLDIASDGRIAAAALDGGAYVWAPRTGGPAAGYDVALRLVDGTGLYAVEWSPDGRRLAAVGQRARLSIWTTDPAAARASLCLRRGRPHDGPGVDRCLAGPRVHPALQLTTWRPGHLAVWPRGRRWTHAVLMAPSAMP